GGRRPRQPRLSDLGRVALERLRVGDAAGQRAPDLHRVERRHARPRLGQLDPRVGEVDAPGRRADGQAEEQPLVLRAIALRREPAVQLAPERVEQDRILPRLLGEDALGEAGDEHHVERAPPRLLERAHEHPPVAHRRPPITAESTRSFSHFHGARRAPSRTGLVSESSTALSPDGASSSGGADPSAPSVSASSSAATHTSPPRGGAPSAPSAGTWPSDRYSAKRRAESFSSAQSSRTRSARPAGSGRRAPRAKKAGIPARPSAGP